LQFELGAPVSDPAGGGEPLERAGSETGAPFVGRTGVFMLDTKAWRGAGVADRKCGGSNVSIREPTPSDRLLVTGRELSRGREDAGLLEGCNAIAVRHAANAAKRHPHSHDNLIRRWLSRNRRLSGAVLLHGDTLAFAFQV